MTNNRRNIGLFTCHLDNDYAYEICKGAEYAAKQLDANLIVFSGMFLNASFNDPQNELYDYQYNSVFYYANKENLDALIVSVGAIASFLSEKDINKFLSHFEGIPILTIETGVPGYPCIQTDGSTGLKDAIEHLITAHGRKHICFVNGRESNDNAIQRLHAYKAVLAAHNMPVTKDMIVNGNFSEYCQDIVNELLDKNPDVDAIIFANDQMAVGGYEALTARGIQIGKDVSVIGFDDSLVSITMDPPLSTINVNATDLGYRAVCDAIKLCSSGNIDSSVLPSRFIRRNSCGCELSAYKPSFTLADLKNIDDILDKLDKFLLKSVEGTFYAPIIYKLFNNLWRKILNIAFLKEKTPYPMSIVEDMNKILHSEITQFYPVEKIAHVWRKFTVIFLTYIDDIDKQSLFGKLNVEITSAISLNMSSRLYHETHANMSNLWSSTYITRDTLTYGDDYDKTFSLILSKLKTLGFEGAYLYTYDESIKINPDGSWGIPKTILLNAFFNKNNTMILSDESRRISSVELFDNEYTYYDKRFTAVLTPIFTNDEHHGLFLCNTDVSNFKKIYITCLQLGASFKYLSLLKEQTEMKEQLMLSLHEIHEKNELLNHLSISDELTGVNNRRGFMDKVEYQISIPSNFGRKAMLLFADMDSLKAVNDKFGHKDGDFALKNIAHILSSSFRSTDIIGRIGGDEFVCFAFVDDLDFIKKVQKRIRHLSDELNESCGKPYYIEMSVGISEFECSANTKIEDLLSQADSSLYSNKRYKRFSVIK